MRKVDEEFEKEKQAQFEEEIEIEEQFVLERIFINDEVTVQVTPWSQSSSVLTFSINGPGLSRDTRQLSVEETQTEFMYQNRPQIGKVHDWSNEVKSNWVNVSVNCNISAEI